jgi:Rad3-related DNA helicase
MMEFEDKLDEVYFPLDLKPREQQLEAVEFCEKSIRDGNKYMMLNMSTGTGKSYFTIMFANWYKDNINNNAKFDIITNSKILQYQYTNDFPFIASLKGMNNYYCNFHNTDCSEGKEINKILKRTCDSCPYDKAKNRWLKSEMTITNFALYISMLLYTENLDSKKSNVLIIDEAHEFESVFCDFISTKFSDITLKKCGFSQIRRSNYMKEFKKIKIPDDFIRFVDETFIGDLYGQMDHLTEKLKKSYGDNTMSSTYQKQLTYINGMIEKLKNLLKIYEDNPGNWTIDKLFDKNKNIEIILQPIWAYPYMKELIWDKYDHVIFMSGTILNKEMFSYLNGIDSNLSTYLEIDSPFDVKKRPLYYIKVGKMTYNDKQETFKRQLEVVKKILKKYKDKKGIIHTYNYELSNWIKEHLKDKRLMFHDSDNREKIFDKFVKSKRPVVMVSPSMMSGVDLKDDLSRFAIILKIPYPNISSNKIKNRQKSNKEWYNFMTVSTLIQMYGRTIRSVDDYSDTFILDESFSNILKYNSKYLPKYFTNAIKLLK